MPRLFKNTSSENRRFQSTHMHLFVENKFTDFVKSESMSCSVCVVMSLSVYTAGGYYLRQLHWLPVKQRIHFKLTVLVYKSLHGLALPYLSDDCQLVTDMGRWHLRSSDVYTCVVPWTVTDWRQEFLCSRTAAMEQPTDRDLEERHYVRTL